MIKCRRTEPKFKVDFLENKASNEKVLFYIFDFFFRVESPPFRLYVRPLYFFTIIFTSFENARLWKAECPYIINNTPYTPKIHKLLLIIYWYGTPVIIYYLGRANKDRRITRSVNPNGMRPSHGSLYFSGEHLTAIGRRINRGIGSCRFARNAVHLVARKQLQVHEEYTVRLFSLTRLFPSEFMPVSSCQDIHPARSAGWTNT